MSYKFSPDHVASVTPSDSAEIPATMFIMVTTAGNVAVRTPTGFEAILPQLQPGVQYMIQADQIKATGTTAGGIVAGW